MNPILVILLIAFICVAIIDICDFWGGVTPYLSRILGFKVSIPKPFSCSLCSTHWAGLLYLIIAGEWSVVTYAALLGVSILTPIIENIIRNLIDALGVIINIPMTFFDK